MTCHAGKKNMSSTNLPLKVSWLPPQRGRVGEGAYFQAPPPNIPPPGEGTMHGEKLVLSGRRVAEGLAQGGAP
jgi:hypothetical protein